MMIKAKKNITRLVPFHEADKSLILAIGLLVAIGLIILSSASSVMGYDKFGDAYYYFKNQLIGLGLGIIAFIFLSRTDYHIWRKYAIWFLAGSVVLLLLVFIPGLGADYGKARSWINIFGFSLQPSELVKLFFLLYLAAWLENRKEKLYDIHQGIGPFIAILGFIAFLILLQPDVGTLFIISATSLIVYFAAGGKIRHIIFILVVALLGLALLIQINPYQLNRFKCVTNPDFDKQDICYQVNQSLIAVGSGGIWGRGLGQSRQKFMYLPEASGDSIFAVMAEEIGIIFSIVFIGFYLFIFYKGYVISKNSTDDFGRLLAIGIVSWIIIQSFVNIGGIINLIPMTGVPLPFVSFGGTAILATLAGMGILVNISKYTKKSSL